MVNTMLGDLQQKDMETIDARCASILTRTLDFRNVEKECNAFLGNVLMDDIVQAMIDAEMSTQRQGRSAFKMLRDMQMTLMDGWVQTSRRTRSRSSWT